MCKFNQLSNVRQPQIKHKRNKAILGWLEIGIHTPKRRSDTEEANQKNNLEELRDWIK